MNPTGHKRNRTCWSPGIAVLALAWAFPLLAVVSAAEPARYFEIQVVDDQTGRGVPLVELSTVHHLKWVTDNAGRVALFEPGLMNRDVFFSVFSHGYELRKDGFGYTGARLLPRVGERAEIKIHRVNLAERLYRITGEGLYRDSVLLGKPTPLAEPNGTALVVGQDSAQVAVLGGKIYWFWGDTSRLAYPLGNFHSSGATADLPGHGGLPPAEGVNLRYFTNADGFCRPMCKLDNEPGMVWLDGLVTLKDDQGEEQLVAHASRMKSLGERVEHSLVVFNRSRNAFELLRRLELTNHWQCLRGQPIRHLEKEGEYLYVGETYLNTRVPATWRAVLDLAQYEALAPAADGAGELVWQKRLPPANPNAKTKQGATWTRFTPLDVAGGKPVRLHQGSVRWNEYRRKFIWIAPQEGGSSSHLGEVWYAEADHPSGPWPKAVKVITHNRYSFYNPVHHPFLNEQGGRWIYFEGTYAETFSGNPAPTPRYDYNQMMYRLDLQLMEKFFAGQR